MGPKVEGEEAGVDGLAVRFCASRFASLSTLTRRYRLGVVILPCRPHDTATPRTRLATSSGAKTIAFAYPLCRKPPCVATTIGGLAFRSRASRSAPLSTLTRSAPGSTATPAHEPWFPAAEAAVFRETCGPFAHRPPATSVEGPGGPLFCLLPGAAIPGSLSTQSLRSFALPSETAKL